MGVLGDVGLVDPVEGSHEEVVEGRGDVAHEAHEEEGELEDVVLDEAETADERVVPGYAVEGEEEGEGP